MIKRFLLTFLVLLLIFGGLFGYKAYVGYKIGQFMAHRKFPPVNVSVSVAASGDWQPYTSSIGDIISPQTVNVTTQVAGQVTHIYFRSGQFISKGSPLVTLDDSVQAAQLKQYEAQLILNRFNYMQYKKAYLKNAVSKASYIQMKSLYRQNEAQIAQTKTIIADMHIKAPFTGVLGIRNTSLVNIGQYINTGTAIIPLFSVSPVYADFTLPQNYIGKLKKGQEVDVKTDSFPDKVFHGTIKAVSVNVNNVSRNITLRIVISNKKMLLRPGMFVTGRILSPLIHDVVTVPANAITYNPYGDFVYEAVKKGPVYVAEATYIKTGQSSKGRVVVLKGVKPGDIIITAGQVSLRNGMPVSFKKPKKAKAGA